MRRPLGGEGTSIRKKTKKKIKKKTIGLGNGRKGLAQTDSSEVGATIRNGEMGFLL